MQSVLFYMCHLRVTRKLPRGLVIDAYCLSKMCFITQTGSRAFCWLIDE
jgi:hypothetical protein